MKALFLAFALLPLLAQAAPQRPQALSAPQRVVSLNLCTDQLLLMLAPREHIASVTYLAANPEYSTVWRQAQGLHLNDGLAEQIVPLQPDLVLAPAHAPGSAMHLLKALGFRVETVNPPHTMNEVEDFVRHMGELLGEQARAEQLINNMRQKLASAHPADDSRRPLAVVYAPNGYTAGRHSLKNEVLELAGYRNLGAELGIEYYGNLGIEQLLNARPDLIIIDDSTSNQDSLAQRFTRHPALAKMKNTRQLHVNAGQWLCAGPHVADVVSQLAQAHP